MKALMVIEYFKIRSYFIYQQKSGVDIGWTNYFTNQHNCIPDTYDFELKFYFKYNCIYNQKNQCFM